MQTEPNAAKPLHPAQTDMVRHFAAALENMGCGYFIALPGGEEIKNRDMVCRSDISKSATLMYGRGVLTTYLRPFMDEIQVGQLLFVPHGEYDAKLLRQAAMSHGHKLWGNGACKTLPAENGDDGFLVFRTIGDASEAAA